MMTLSSEKLQVMVLLRLACPRSKPISSADLQKALRPLVKTQLSDGEWRAQLERTLTELQTLGEIGGKLRLTELGSKRVCQVLGLKHPPRAKNWQDFKRKHVQPLILRSFDADGATDPLAVSLARSLGVEASPKASVSGLVNLWLAKQLQLTIRPVTLQSLRTELLARELQIRLGSKPDLDRLARVAAAKWAHAAKGDAQSLLEALTARWLSSNWEPSDEQQPGEDPLEGEQLEGEQLEGEQLEGEQLEGDSPAVEAPPATVISNVAPRGHEFESARPRARLEGTNFVSKVQAAMRSPRLRRFGPDKVFIASVWEELKTDPELDGLDEQGFRRALLDAHRSGALQLARADLVSAMDARDVAASEIAYLNATFHFIQAGSST